MTGRAPERSPISRVLVTGASRGIGRAIAERLVADGRRVVAVARDRARLESIEGAAVIARDLRQPEGLVEEAAATLGGLDGLIHAAGVAAHGPLDAITDEALALAWEIHVRAPLVMTRDLATALRAEHRPGSVVHIASTLALRPAAQTLVYASSKAALVAMTKALALELAPHAIRVNAVAPGVVDTDMVRALRLAPGEPEPGGEERERRVSAQLEALRALHPLGRLGTAPEVADTVVHALDAAWMTGSILTLDGGLTAG